MTRSKKLLILMAAFIVLAALALLTSKMNLNSEESTEENVSVDTVAAENVTGIFWKFGETEYGFSKNEDSWIYSQDETQTVDTTYLDTLLNDIANINASKVIEGENADDLTQFGLDEPECSITVSFGDESLNINIGAENEVGGKRYLSIGDGNVYMVDSEILTDFECDSSDLIKSDDTESDGTDSETEEADISDENTEE